MGLTVLSSAERYCRDDLARRGGPAGDDAAKDQALVGQVEGGVPVVGAAVSCMSPETKRARSEGDGDGGDGGDEVLDVRDVRRVERLRGLVDFAPGHPRQEGLGDPARDGLVDEGEVRASLGVELVDDEDADLGGQVVQAESRRGVRAGVGGVRRGEREKPGG